MRAGPCGESSRSAPSCRNEAVDARVPRLRCLRCGDFLDNCEMVDILRASDFLQASFDRVSMDARCGGRKVTHVAPMG
jgi:hypothetical protein